MTSYLAVILPPIIAISIQTTSITNAAEAETCIRFDVSEENTQAVAFEGKTEIIQLTAAGKDSFRKTTAENLGQVLCVYADDVLIVKAAIRAEIDNGVIVVQAWED